MPIKLLVLQPKLLEPEVHVFNILQVHFCFPQELVDVLAANSKFEMLQVTCCSGENNKQKC